MKIEDIKKGEFVRLKLSGKTYTKQGFDRSSKKYELNDYEGASDYKYVKKGTLMFVGFEY